MRPMVARTAGVGIVLAVLSAAGPAPAENAWVASTAIRVIDLERGDVVGHLTVAPDQVVTEIDFSPSGDRAYVASMGGLFEVDTASLGVIRDLQPRPTCAVSVARDADRLAALHLQPAGDGLADRERGIPTTVTLAVYRRSTGELLAATELHGRPLRVRLSPDGERIFVVDSGEAVLSVFDGAGAAQGEIDLAPDAAPDATVMCTDLGMAPDANRLAVMRSGAGGSSLVVVEPTRPIRASAVRVVDLGDTDRGRGARFSADGGDIWLSSIGHVARWRSDSADVAWIDVGHQYSLIAPSPSGRFLVMATPTLDADRGSGGVMIADAEGNPLRVVELPDISPYTLAVQP